MLKTGICSVSMSAVLLMLSVNVRSQTVTYNHDSSVMNQFTVGETGAGSLTPDIYYDVLHKNYRNSVMTTNKQIFRTQMTLALSPQESHAESIDSALTHRQRVEMSNIADRTPGVTDVAWQVEKSKIECKLAILKKNIERITLEGGTAKDYRAWMERYNAINCGLQSVRDAYMPQGKRKEQYIAIYRDILLKNVEVCEYIRYLRFARYSKGYHSDVPSLRHADVFSVTRSALGRWKVAMAAGSGFSGKGDESADDRWHDIRYGD